MTAAVAEANAAVHNGKLTSFLTITQKAPPRSQMCTWHLSTAVGLSPLDRASVAWIVAAAAMKYRGGNSIVYSTWRDAALAGVRLTGTDRKVVMAFVDSVFGLPPTGKSEEHLVGHVAEWMWYLHACESVDPARTPVVLEPPKFNVTEPGADGFIVFRETVTNEHHYRLWELKKHTAAGSVSSTVSTAYNQLSTNAMRYLAQQVSIYSTSEGAVGELCSKLVEFWLESHERAGVGIGVTSTTIPPPNTCFTTMGKHFPGFDKPGQLEGLLVAVEDLLEIAKDVRGYLWIVL
ncbi:hypothetical protein [Glutamicibacter sp. FBE19]|uniref:hypothetical protein n=1 Tax=Glutamicibacter sp. FBE19 TaxID=2761534 RepID=UPI0018969954|nr:hypothetical protein [Glutamicibacter sp. FBE19]MBF6672797.1 hypothetical protein [Glutamicibacter sp. FBE19]